MVAGVRRVQIDIRGFDRELSSRGHRVARIHREVHDDLFDLTRIGPDTTQRWRQRRLETNILPDHPLQQRLGAVHDFVQIDVLGLEDLPTAERQQLACQRGRAFAGLVNFSNISAGVMVRRQILEQHRRVAENRRQQIVEVVGHAAGEVADGVHLL